MTRAKRVSKSSSRVEIIRRNNVCIYKSIRSIEKILKNFFPLLLLILTNNWEKYVRKYIKNIKNYILYTTFFLQVFPPRFFAKFIFFNNSYASHINREINNISISINLQHQRLPAISHFPSRKRSNAPNSPFQARQHISNSQNAIKKQRRK